MEEVGELYFNDLFSRSFFQRSREHEMRFIMHDLLNDLAKYICGDFCFTFNNKESHQILNTTRHLSLLENSHKRMKTLHNANRLRTFLPLWLALEEGTSKQWMSSTLMQELFSKFKFFRVLSLSGFVIENELLDTIGNLKHLRYLDLSSTNVKKLPDSICSLYNLQTLKLRDCRYLEELPLNLLKLTNLRYLDFSGTKVRKMPMDVGKLKNLQVLSSFYVGKGIDANIQQLGELNLHGTLSISGLQNIVNPSDASAANLKNKVHLVKLELEWNENIDNSEKDREVLEKLQPSKHMKDLSVCSYGGTRFPDWFGDSSLSNVVSLKLSNCENCVLLPPLGILSSLEELWLIGLSGIVVVGSEFYGNGSSSSSAILPFASLKILKFENMQGWEVWDCKNVTGAFSCLQKLFINNCPYLKECLPEQLPCLLKLKITNCSQLVASVPLAPSIDRLHVINCGELDFDYQPSTLRVLTIGGMEGSLLELVRDTLSCMSLESLIIRDCPTMNIPLRGCYNFLEYLYIRYSCDSLRTFPLVFFPKLQHLDFQYCSNLEMISLEHDNSLKHLSIYGCPKFVSFSMGRSSAPRLEG
jgi:Leucine-rich repeat (LRR) protein